MTKKLRPAKRAPKPNSMEATSAEHQALMAAYLGRELRMRRKLKELFREDKP